MFRKLTDDFWVAPQISAADVAQAAADGARMIVNNRPDGEEPGAPQGEDIAAAAAAHGLAYVAIPVTHAGFSHPQLIAMANALQRSEGPILAYCRSGTRSTLLWALTTVHNGGRVVDVTAAATAQGYDLSPIGGMLAALAGKE